MQLVKLVKLMMGGEVLSSCDTHCMARTLLASVATSSPVLLTFPNTKWVRTRHAGDSSMIRQGATRWCIGPAMPRQQQMLYSAANIALLRSSYFQPYAHPSSMCPLAASGIIYEVYSTRHSQSISTSLTLINCFN